MCLASSFNNRHAYTEDQQPRLSTHAHMYVAWAGESLDNRGAG